MLVHIPIPTQSPRGEIVLALPARCYAQVCTGGTRAAPILERVQVDIDRGADESGWWIATPVDNPAAWFAVQASDLYSITPVIIEAQ